MENSKKISERINSIEKELKLLEEGSKFRSMWKKGQTISTDLGADEELYYKLLDKYFDMENGVIRLRYVMIEKVLMDLFGFDEIVLERMFPLFVTVYETRGPRAISVKDSIEVKSENDAKQALKDLVKKHSSSGRIVIEDVQGSLLR